MKLYHKNPRQITAKQYGDLEKWLHEFGDLSGIVHDLNSDEIISGNQRGRVFDVDECEIVTVQEFDEPDAQGTVALGYVIWEGNRYGYRAVRWTERQCEAANVIANRAGGEWDWDVLANEFDTGDLLDWGFTEFDFQLAGWDTEEEPPADPGAIPDGKFAVIYADPPWDYDNSGFSQSAASHYPTMPTSDICGLETGARAAENCALFLWATSPLLPDAFAVMSAWGFDYKASRVWVKDRSPGIGWFVRTRHEMLLIGARGSAHPAEKLDSVISAPVGRHSEKPKCIYDDIERCYTGPYLELFARNTRDGWMSWGNEAGTTMTGREPKLISE